jgi:putative Mg2+ transporter-C (MgtC) family protein
MIGVERENRGRPAGFRTHILVSLSSALLMLAAVHQAEWTFDLTGDVNLVMDPTRMAHGILTGIGFLCAGVIFRTGFSIHGLTTAASLWITSAIGILFGVGMFALGALATVVTAIILIVLRVVSKGLPQNTVVDAEVCWTAGAAPADAVEAILSEQDGALKRMGYTRDGDQVRRLYRLRASDARLAELGDRLGAVPGVTGFRLDPRDD